MLSDTIWQIGECQREVDIIKVEAGGVLFSSVTPPMDEGSTIEDLQKLLDTTYNVSHD